MVKLSREQIKQVKAMGYSVTGIEEGLTETQWLDYWKPLKTLKGEPILDENGSQSWQKVRLPADQFSLGRYLLRGFRLTEPDDSGKYRCPHCDAEFEKKNGLFHHMRTHGNVQRKEALV